MSDKLFHYESNIKVTGLDYRHVSLLALTLPCASHEPEESPCLQTDTAAVNSLFELVFPLQLRVRVREDEYEPVFLMKVILRHFPLFSV